MLVQTSINCLNEVILQRLAEGRCSPAELADCESHISQCDSCRQMIESRTLDNVWNDEMLPAFKLDHDAEYESVDRGLTHQAVLSVLGPTDNPHMLGRIGSYEVVALLGVGGMGAVFKAFDAALNRFVAIKMMLPHLAVSGAARQRFQREGRAAAAVVSDFVLPIYAVSEWQGVPYLVTQFCAGENLQKRLKSNGPLSLEATLRIAMQTARGLAAAHAQGLVHRDVKPSNILLDGSVERAMLADFGLARAVDDASLTRTGLIAGTPQYMSPEQVRGENVDAQSDLFSLGSTMYAMCTGHPPFRADLSYAVLHRIVGHTPRSIREINPDLPAWLEWIVMKMLAKSPTERFESAEQLAELLEACLAHVQQPTVVQLPTLLTQTSMKRKRYSLFTKLVATAFALLMMLAGVVIVLELDKGTLTIECDADDVPIRIVQGDKVVEKLSVSREGKSTKIASGKYTVEIEQPYDKAIIADGTVTITRAGKQIVKVRKSETSEQNSANNEIQTVTHVVSKLLGNEKDLRAEQRMAELVKLICSTIDPESWSDRRCQILPYTANRCFVVSQTPANHQAIAKLLKDIEDKLAATSAQAEPAKAVPAQAPTESLKNDVQVTRDDETGIIEIRGESDEEVQRTTKVVEELFGSPKHQEAKASNEADPYKKFFDAINRGVSNQNPQPIPLTVLRDFVLGEGSSVKQVNNDEKIVIKSITNAVRSTGSDQTTVYEFDVDGIGLMHEMIQPLLGKANEVDAVLTGLLKDRNGPQIDLRKILAEQLGKRVTLTCGSNPSGRLKLLVEMKVIDRAAFLPNFNKLFKTEGTYRGADYYVLEQRSAGEPRRPKNTEHGCILLTNDRVISGKITEHDKGFVVKQQDGNEVLIPKNFVKIIAESHETIELFRRRTLQPSSRALFATAVVEDRFYFGTVNMVEAAREANQKKEGDSK